MKQPDIPGNEATRLETLRSHQILDTPAEERFDRITRLARRIFGVPIALVSLVDENRQWFKSCMGLGVSETPREISFCGHAILGDDVFIIQDAQKDERFCDNPLVVEDPHIRFYAGYPLSASNGSKLGTLCIIDREPKTLNPEDIEALKDLAAMVEEELVAIQMATLDELTGISNRRGFMALAQYSLSLCVRQKIPASLVFMDLDKFKQINDTLGHAEGDRALIAFAEQMKTTCRDSDIFARLGGDEFVVLLTNTRKPLAEELVARLARALSEYNLGAQRGYDVAFSHGIVEFDPDQHRLVEELLEEGDALMYQHKSGRR